MPVYASGMDPAPLLNPTPTSADSKIRAHSGHIPLETMGTVGMRWEAFEQRAGVVAGIAAGHETAGSSTSRSGSCTATMTTMAEGARHRLAVRPPGWKPGRGDVEPLSHQRADS